MIEKLIQLLGYAINSNELSSLMLELKMDMTPKPPTSLPWTRSSNPQNDLSLTFNTVKCYKQEFGDPLSILDKSEDTLILTEIDIDSRYEKTNKEPTVLLPFNLEINDDSDSIIKKFGKKPFEKGNADYGYAWWFMFEEYRILVALNSNQQLRWLRIMKLDKQEKQKQHLKRDLAKQNKNIKPENVPVILKFKEHLPTTDWIKRKEEGDDLFTDNSIRNVSELLEKYVNNIAEYTQAKNATAIYNSVKKVVKNLNSINEKNNYFIETMEREELGGFINDLVIATGLIMDKNVDLTQEWREW